MTLRAALSHNQRESVGYRLMAKVLVPVPVYCDRFLDLDCLKSWIGFSQSGSQKSQKPEGHIMEKSIVHYGYQH